MDYGVTTKNKFELFLDDEDADPLEILRMKEEENEKQKKIEAKGKDGKNAKDAKTAKNKKNNKALTTVQDQKTKSADPKDTRKEEKPRNKPRNDDRQNRPPRENRERDLPPRRQNQENRYGFGAPNTQSGNGESRFEGNRGRGERRGRGRGGRGGPRGGPGGFDRFGKRDYDRHSGSDKTSGIKATEKREGAGAHNWGTMKDDIDDQMNTSNPEQTRDAAGQAEDAENQQPNAGQEGAEDTPQEEQGPSEMTLDEYKALQNKAKQGSAFNVRKAGEGCDNSQWKKTYMLKKKPAEEESDEDEDDEDFEDDRRKKQHVPIEITFGDQSRSRGGGGRGRGRGRGGNDRSGRRGGRGGSRGGNGGQGGGRQAQAPNVEDEFDFPSLGKPAA